jgi:hypothetical protein
MMNLDAILTACNPISMELACPWHYILGDAQDDVPDTLDWSRCRPESFDQLLGRSHTLVISHYTNTPICICIYTYRSDGKVLLIYIYIYIHICIYRGQYRYLSINIAIRTSRECNQMVWSGAPYRDS